MRKCVKVYIKVNTVNGFRLLQTVKCAQMYIIKKSFIIQSVRASEKNVKENIKFVEIK